MKTIRGIIACIFVGAIVHADERPNVLVVMVDDMGYSDVGCYGGEIDTPNINTLAAGGLRFTQAYNASRCCPTRAALLTGKYPHEVGLIRNGRSLSKDVPTIAEILRANGYRTAMAGKWHLTEATVLRGDNFDNGPHLEVLNNQKRVAWFGDKETYPAARGFEKHFGIIWGVASYFHPFSLVDGFKPVYDLPDDFYMTDALSRKAVEYINQFSKGNAPFFIYLAYTAPHWPLHARPEDQAKYKGKYDGGYDALREARYKRQVDMKLIDPAINPLPPLDKRDHSAWNDLPEEKRALLSARFETHAAMVDRIDQGLGDVLRALKESGELDNTIIIFLSDNGASPEYMYRPGYDRPSQTPDGRKIRYTGQIPVEDVGRDDTMGGIGPEWASAANTPLRYWKKESYNGGCQTPFIVYWPKGLKTKPGSVTDQFCHVMDIQATVLDVAGIEYPAKFKGKEMTPPRGKSLLPILQGSKRDGYDMIFFEHEGGAAVRQDNWKLVRLKPADHWSLYDFSKDRTETTDVADQYPERVAEMAAAWKEWWTDIRRNNK